MVLSLAYQINVIFFAIILAARRKMCTGDASRASLVLSQVGHLHPIFKPHRGAFVAFPKQNDKCPKGNRHTWN